MFLDDIVVTGTPLAARPAALAIGEAIGSPPVSLADVTAGLVTATAAELPAAAAGRQVDAELARATRAIKLDH